MRSTSKVGYDQNTKEYYYIPGCSHNNDGNNNSSNKSSEESRDDWCEHCRGDNSGNNKCDEQNQNNANNCQTNCNENSQTGNRRCGLQAWIKNAQGATPSGERIVFNIIREHQNNEYRIYYDENSNEFVFNQDGVYLVKWSINVTPSSYLGTVYLSFTLNKDSDFEVLSRVYTAYQGINGIRNITNHSSVIFNAKKNDRYSLNNASDGLINIGSLNSSIGGNLSIVRIS